MVEQLIRRVSISCGAEPPAPLGSARLALGVGTERLAVVAHKQAETEGADSAALPFSALRLLCSLVA
jgi:hypothetical protein